MANKVTGMTDTTGALTVNQRSARSMLLVGESLSTGVQTEVLFNIAGTADAETRFGVGHPYVEITKVLIQNGVDFIRGMCIGAYGSAGEPYASIDEAYEAAFDRSLSDSSILVVVIDTTANPSINTKLKQHLNIAESNDLFRIGCIGGPIGADDAALTALATSVLDKRMLVVGPNVIDGAGNEKDGIYTAAGLGACIMSEAITDPALPMNGVQIMGYSGVIKSLLESERENLRNGGVTAIFPQSGTPTVWRAVTSYTTDEIWKELTTVMIADNVLDSVETRLRTNYKRTKNVARILNAIRTDVIDVLQIKNGLEIIQNFDMNTVTVIKDPEDLYGALVDYEFQVVTPLYTITIRQHMKL